MKGARESAGRMALIAGNTLREGLRQRLLLLLVPAGGLLVGGGRLLQDVNFGTTDRRFLLDVGFGAISFLGAVLAIAAAAQLFFSEIDRRSALLVLARPVSRTEFTLGKLGGILGLLLLFCAAMTLILAGLVLWREGGGTLSRGGGEAESDGWRDMANLAVCGWVQWLRLGVLAGMTLLAASYARSALFAVAAGFLALVLCQLQHVAVGIYRLAESPWAGAGAGLLSWVVPDFEVFNVADAMATGASLPPGLVGRITIYGFAYIGAFGGLAVYCFRHREL
jgi:ABC-type transport system involved in multi-copper enzyme maturation permease subunit